MGSGPGSVTHRLLLASCMDQQLSCRESFVANMGCTRFLFSFFFFFFLSLLSNSHLLPSNGRYRRVNGDLVPSRKTVAYYHNIFEFSGYYIVLRSSPRRHLRDNTRSSYPPSAGKFEEAGGLSITTTRGRLSPRCSTKCSPCMRHDH